MTGRHVHAMDFNAAVERARSRLEIECPRRALTLRARLYRWFFGVWPAEVAVENWNRAARFRSLVEAEIEREVAEWRASDA